VRKFKNQIKKLEEEIHGLHTNQASVLYEKKKNIDEISQLHDQITRKEYDLARVQK
jgi:hypothetical protein